MSRAKRSILCGAILSTGLVAQAGLEHLNRTERPALRRPLASLPLEMGDWLGQDLPVDSELIERAQTSEYLNRRYESRKRPGLQINLWVNYSREGTNLRHTPEICLPSGGWTKVESQTRVIAVASADAQTVPVTFLSYVRDELVQNVGFWYYIFGEGRLENYVRRLPITSRSSHGQATRGSSMTVEVFYAGESDREGDALKEFAQALLSSIEPILPEKRAVYYIP